MKKLIVAALCFLTLAAGAVSAQAQVPPDRMAGPGYHHRHVPPRYHRPPPPRRHYHRPPVYHPRPHHRHPPAYYHHPVRP